MPWVDVHVAVLPLGPLPRLQAGHVNLTCFPSLFWNLGTGLFAEMSRFQDFWHFRRE